MKQQIFISGVQKELAIERRAICDFIWRDALTPSRLDQLGLNERQRNAIGLLRTKPRLTNTDYQKLNAVARTTAKRDLEELVQWGLLELSGSGRGAHYRVAGKWSVNGPNGALLLTISEMGRKWPKWPIFHRVWLYKGGQEETRHKADKPATEGKKVIKFIDSKMAHASGNRNGMRTSATSTMNGIITTMMAIAMVASMTDGALEEVWGRIGV